MKSQLAAPLPFKDWPAVDQQAWTLALNGDLLSQEAGGGAALWRAATRETHQRQYGGWLGWLKSIGQLDQAKPPAQRAVRARVRGYLDAMEAIGLADHSRAGRLQSLADVLRVMQPQADVRFISRAAARVSSKARRKKDLLPRLRPPAELFQLGQDLMNLAEDVEQPMPRLKRACLFRDGLLIALWVCRPFRISNLASIEIGRQLIVVGSGRRLEFPAEEMKGGRPFACKWPDRLEGPLMRYLHYYRPQLLQRGAGAMEMALWISQFGRSMPPSSVGQIIRLRTRARFGEALGPHLIRHIDATFLAEHEPERRLDVPIILGHASLETSEEHYILGNSMKAIERFQRAIISNRVGRRGPPK